MRVSSTQSPFEALVESIIYQQIHGKAAAAIHRRLLEGFYPLTTDQHFAAQQLLDCPNEQLRAAGLSRPRRKNHRRHRAHSRPYPPHVR